MTQPSNGLFEAAFVLLTWLGLYIAFQGTPLECLIPAYSIGFTVFLLIRFGRKTWD
jgi:hypothetical protein